MDRGQMTALLSVLALAGWQHRDQITEVLKGATQQAQAPTGSTASAPEQPSGGLGGLLGGVSQGGGGLGGLGSLLGGLGSGGSAGGILSGGLGGLLEHFTQNGQGDTANSWVQDGPNKPIDNGQLSQALGPDVLKDLTAKTGLSADDILSRLSRDLPKAVDGLTPDGKVPDSSAFA
jgi:uncharacterized protein YidB (DUF937 family)